MAKNIIITQLNLNSELATDGAALQVGHTASGTVTGTHHRDCMTPSARRLIDPNYTVMFANIVNTVKNAMGGDSKDAAGASKDAACGGACDHAKESTPKSRRADFDAEPGVEREEKDNLLFEVYPVEEVLRHDKLPLLEAQLRSLVFPGSTVTIDESKTEDLAYGVKVIVLRLIVTRLPGRPSPSADDIETAIKSIQVGNKHAVSSVKFLAESKT